MKIDNKTWQAIVLGLLMVALVVVLITQLKNFGGGPSLPPVTPSAHPQTSPAPAPAPNNPAAVTAPIQKAGVTTNSPQPDNETGLTWLQEDQVPQVLNDMVGARDPFVDIKGVATLTTTKPAPPTPVPHVAEPGTEPPGPPKPGGGMSPSGPIPPILPFNPTPAEGPTFHASRILEWLTADDMKQKLDQPKAPNLTVSVEHQLNEVILDGPKQTVETALSYIASQDVPPPPPPFVLTGVVITDQDVLAMLSLEGRIYRVTRGQTIPLVGWTVTNITSNSVTLTDGRRLIRVQLSGGNQI